MSQADHICPRCGVTVAGASSATTVGGSHEHEVENPAGYTYHLGCFDEASGAVASGESSDEATFFAGFTWQRAFCRACSQHLGWRYRSPKCDFFGLILSA